MLTTEEYLEKILENQDLDEDSEELKALRERRVAVEALLREAFAESDPSIRYGGSKAKGTMLKESHDLDVTCFFPREEDEPAGDTLREIYERVEAALRKEYIVERKRCALRLLAKGTKKLTHVDVVPGRFTDDDKEDAYLHVTTGEKGWLKTNLQVQIDHVKGSGRTQDIRLVKLWKVRNGLTNVRSFVLELLVIDILAETKGEDLASSFVAVVEHFRDHSDELAVEDPANPTGNDLSAVLDAGVKATLKAAAERTLTNIENSGWESVFGPVEEPAKAARVAAVVRSVAATPAPARPWYAGDR